MKNVSHKKRQNRNTSSSSVEDPVVGLVQTLAATLFFARFLIPTESAADGETLWLVLLWIAVGLMWAWGCWRTGQFTVRYQPGDVAISALVGGHVLSAIVIVATEGQKRAALNMLWEWVGLGVLFFVLRQIAASVVVRKQWTLMLVSLGTALATFGIWQHFVWYPNAVSAYDTVRNELDELENAANQNSINARQQREIQLLQAKLVQSGVPPHALSGRSRTLFEQRLRASTEPFGFFALANTFAGLVASGLLLMLGFVSRRNRLWIRLALTAAGALCVGFCLVLTKSRTAWVGVIAGIVLWCWWSFGGRFASPRVVGRSILVFLGVAVVALGLGVATGGLDAEVLNEAPKSLQYRGQYWLGTLVVIRGRPVFGTGPGNFRQHYLKHKLAESSEEIADPHNLFLDVWTNGGLIALAGLLAAIVWLGRTMLPGKESKDEQTQTNDRDAAFGHAIIGTTVAFALVMTFLLLFRDAFDVRIAVIGAVALAYRIALRIGLVDFIATPVLFASTGCGLVVHLCGAGGIAMPAISQLLMLVFVFATSAQTKASLSEETKLAEQSFSSRRVVVSLAGVMCLLLALCLITATAPVENSLAHLRAAAGAPTEAVALERYVAAAEADPLSPEPLEALSSLAFRRWESESDRKDEKKHFENAIEFATIAVELDPFNAGGYRRLAEFHRRRYERVGDLEDLKLAISYLGKAVERYPTQTDFRAELASLLSEYGEATAARSEATEALRLDAINREAGHADKYLQAETVGRMRQITNDAIPERRTKE